MEQQWEDAYPGFTGWITKNLILAAGRSPEQGCYSALYAALSDEVAHKGWDGAYLADPVSRRKGVWRKDPVLQTDLDAKKCNSISIRAGCVG